MQKTLDEWVESTKRMEKFLKKKDWQNWKTKLNLAKDYRKIKIPKKKGEFRTILIPSNELKELQKEILSFLKNLYPNWYCEIQGLYRGSYVEHARYHSHSRFIFQFDLKDAFPSVNTERLRKIIHRLVCNGGVVGTAKDAQELTDLIIEFTTYDGALPQGAPTSPFLFYLYLIGTGLIESLVNLCQPQWKISCYVDNFVISGSKPLPEEIKKKIIKTVEGKGFKINTEKIRSQDCRNGNPLITGLRVDGKGRISLPKKKIRKIRGMIHRAAFNLTPEKKKEIEGVIASLKPIYGENLPNQIRKPYQLFIRKLDNPLKNFSGGIFYFKNRKIKKKAR